MLGESWDTDTRAVYQRDRQYHRGGLPMVFGTPRPRTERRLTRIHRPKHVFVGCCIKPIAGVEHVFDVCLGPLLEG